ncbi:ATPase, partial [Methylobacterium sp. WL30]
MNKTPQARTARPVAVPRAEAALGRAGERLLAALAPEGAYA